MFKGIYIFFAISSEQVNYSISVVQDKKEYTTPRVYKANNYVQATGSFKITIHKSFSLGLRN